jgi:hypothetical protein
MYKKCEKSPEKLGNKNGIVLAISIVSDCDHPLWPVSELGVRHDDGDEDGQRNQAGSEHVDGEGLGEHLVGVLRAERGHSAERRGAIKVAIDHVRNPLGVGDTIVVKERKNRVQHIRK